ncbi:hypothetical protein LSM04_009235 [Trypanosoma melophagium]|uniref:uncharacterized protein n=1 Tax=Trypanosoma melophagium TaxID=715481 RepID=UPI00351A386E|nr:hypothetical protein LSM04_006266 [Trypanosoma melophagium]KAH9600040.1 hypothetical protein LSM04_009235 [Trypanosoma melophagium]
MIVASLRGTCVTPIAFEPNTKAEENACVHKHTRAYAQTGAGRDGKGWSGEGGAGHPCPFLPLPLFQRSVPTAVRGCDGYYDEQLNRVLHRDDAIHFASSLILVRTLCGHLFALTAAPLLHQRDLSPPATRSWRCGRDDERTKKGISCRAAGLRARSADMKRFDLLQSIPFSR